jgi:hypothetical protein
MGPKWVSTLITTRVSIGVSARSVTSCGYGIISGRVWGRAHGGFRAGDRPTWRPVCLTARPGHGTRSTKGKRSSPRDQNWVQGLDSNQRPSGYEPDELPGCSTLQQGEAERPRHRATCQRLSGVLRTSRLPAGATPGVLAGSASKQPPTIIHHHPSIARRPIGRPVCHQIHRSKSA